MKIPLPAEVLDFLRKHSSVFDNKKVFVKAIMHGKGPAKHTMYYFLPYWIKVEMDSTDKAEILSFDSLPNELREFIHEERDKKFRDNQQKAIDGL